MDRNAATKLVALISNVEDSVASVLEQFHSDFNFGERINALSQMSTLLINGIWNHQHQVAVALIIYFEFSDSPISENPFFDALNYVNEVFSSKPNTFSPVLCELLPVMLCGESIDFLRQLNFKQILQTSFSSTTQLPKINAPEPVDSRILIQESVQNDLISNDKDIIIEILSNGYTLSPFQPPMIRDIPDLLPITSDELQYTYVSSFNTIPFIYDNETNTRAIALGLLQKGTEEFLNDDEVEIVIDSLKKYPSLIEKTKFSNKQLNSLVEYNSKVATEYFAHSLAIDSSFSSFLSQLELTVSSVEVIKNLFFSKLISKELMNNFIVQSINKILNISDFQTKATKSRFLCRFLIYLLQNEFVFSTDVLVEVTSFCLEIAKNQKITEVQELYCLLETPIRN